MVRPLTPGGTAGVGRYPFVGRGRELGRLLDTIRTPPAVALVEGEAGAGKSRLVAEAAAVLRAEGRPVLTGLCHPLREPSPYGPLADALDKAVPWLGDTALPQAAAPLVRLLPALADRLPRGSGGAGRHRAGPPDLLAAVRALLRMLGPAVLVVEDLQWADDASRDLLLLLARDLPEQLSLVLTHRTEDLPAGRLPLGSAYRRPPGTAGATLHLRPLTVADVRELATAALGGPVTGALVAALHERSQGLPLVLEEDLAMLDETEPGRLVPPGPGAAGDAARLRGAAVPRGLREAVSERIAALSPPGAAIAEAAAVLAGPADEPALVEVAGLDPESGGRGLVEALRGALLREADGHRYAFRHPLAARTVYELVPLPRRLRLHRRAVAVLERSAPAPRARLAHHRLALGDRAAWLEQAEEAAAEAAGDGDPATAVTLLCGILGRPGLDPDRYDRAALALARLAADGLGRGVDTARLRGLLELPDLPAAARGAVRLALGLVLLDRDGDRTGTTELLTAVPDLADHPEPAARAALALALDETEPPDRSREWLERAEKALDADVGVSPDICAGADASPGPDAGPGPHVGPGRGSDTSVGPDISAGPDVDASPGPDTGARAAVLTTRLTLRCGRGDPSAWPLLDRLPRDGEDVEARRRTARALGDAGDAATELGHDLRASALLAESVRLAALADTPVLALHGRAGLLRLDLLAGRWDDLAERFDALADDALAAGCPDLARPDAERSLALGLLSAVRGRSGHALHHLARPEAAAHRPTAPVALRTAAGRASVLLARGGPQEAMAAAEPAVALLRRGATWPKATGLVPVAVEAALACGDRAFAESLAADAEQALRGLDTPAADAELHLARGLLLLDAEPGSAAGHFAAARRAWRSIGRPYDAARATERNGAALSHTDRSEAAAVLAEAVDGYARLGAEGDLSRCRRLAHELGLSRAPSPGRRGYGDRLSPREQQVAGLLAARATNQHIATALRLSPRTVENHVASVLRKLRTTRKSVSVALDRTAAAE
ncbi:AAA family ATPase [Streptomyces sp. NPDC056194]|uniref:helix-turn-helix transcriptional regulator n=1 Tax=unclassified Streptomyces TaxID=2593676 RepID=UPI0035DDD15F